VIVSIYRIRTVPEENHVPLTNRIRESIALVSSLIQAARTTEDAEQRETLLEKAQHELSSVREWTGRVQDRDAWQEIHTQADEFDQTIRKLQAPERT
jgi:hypothetical protein